MMAIEAIMVAKRRTTAVIRSRKGVGNNKWMTMTPINSTGVNIRWDVCTVIARITIPMTLRY